MKYLQIEIYHLIVVFAATIIITNIKFRYDKALMGAITTVSAVLCFYNLRVLLHNIEQRACADMYASEKNLIIYSYNNLAEKLVTVSIVLIAVIFVLFCFENIIAVISGHIIMFYSPFLLYTLSFMMDFTGKMSVWSSYMYYATYMCNSVILLFTIPLLWRKIILSYNVKKLNFKGA